MANYSDVQKPTSVASAKPYKNNQLWYSHPQWVRLKGAFLWGRCLNSHIPYWPQLDTRRAEKAKGESGQRAVWKSKKRTRRKGRQEIAYQYQGEMKWWSREKGWGQPMSWAGAGQGIIGYWATAVGGGAYFQLTLPLKKSADFSRGLVVYLQHLYCWFRSHKHTETTRPPPTHRARGLRC